MIYDIRFTQHWSNSNLAWKSKMAMGKWKCQGDHGGCRANCRCCIPALAGFVSPHSMGPGGEQSAATGTGLQGENLRSIFLFFLHWLNLTVQSEPTGLKKVFQRLAVRLRDRLTPSQAASPALDALLTRANPVDSLAERLDWAEDFLQWVRRGPPATRLRLFIQLLDRQPEAKARIAGTLRSLVRDTQALDLFADTGLPRGASFTHELMSRIFSRVLPNPRDSQNLDDVFDRLFPLASDSEWLQRLEPEVAGNFMSLFQSDSDPAGGDWSGLRGDLKTPWCNSRSASAWPAQAGKSAGVCRTYPFGTCRFKSCRLLLKNCLWSSPREEPALNLARN